LYGVWGDFENKRKAVRRGWRNSHKEDPDNFTADETQLV
jgi:hypothetical protein